MKCAWDALLSVLPARLRQQVDNLGRDTMQELRLRVGQPVELILSGQSRMLGMQALEEDITFIVNAASHYSPWAAATSAKGYITAVGGHRIGVAGECVVQGGQVTGIRRMTSLCIRVARGFPGIGDKAPKSGSLLILGPPGAGKTTLLRELIRCRSEAGQAVAVVDERGELFPVGGVFSPGTRTDVLTGCSKVTGVEMALRTLSPACIAVDEITAQEDCQALLSVGWCGVELLATAHARDAKDLLRRKIYQPLADSGLFETLLILQPDKSWHMERMRV